MTVCIANLELFFKNHPELAARKEEIMAAAREKSDNGIIMSGVVNEILGDLSSLFFDELNSPEHTEIWHKQLRNKSPPAILIIGIPNDEALRSGLLEAMKQFQYGPTREESDKGLEKMKKIAQVDEEKNN